MQIPDGSQASGFVSILEDSRTPGVILLCNVLDIDINVNREVSVLLGTKVHLGQNCLIDK
jgi:hypothetical protein